MLLALGWSATFLGQMHSLPINFVAQLFLTMGLIPLFILSKASQADRVEQVTFDNFPVSFADRAIPRWCAFVAVLIFFHSPIGIETVYKFGIVGQCISILLQIWVGYIYFAPILGSPAQTKNMSHAHRVFSLFAMMVPETMIGFFIYIQKETIYPEFLSTLPTAQALHEQQLAGALMWALAMVVDAIWLAIAVQKWFSNEERRGEEFNEVWFAEQDNRL